MGKTILIALVCLLFVAGAAGQIPTFHQFYGEMRDENGNLVEESVNILAYIDGDIKGSGSSENGLYGYSPLFFVENGSNGDTIEFYVNGSLDTTFTFENEAATELHLTLPEDGGGGELACGNGEIDAGEECDLDNITETCQSLGFDSGTLSCNPDCTLNTSQCTTSPVEPPPAGPGTGPGSGPGDGGGSPSLGIDTNGNCVGQPVEVTILNTRGNAAPDATVSIVKDRSTVASETTGTDGKLSFILEQAGEYMIKATKSGYMLSTRRITLVECPEGVTSIDLCEGITCTDQNPCTTDSCDAATGECVHENLPEKTSCGESRECSSGTCVAVQAGEGPAAPGAPGITTAAGPAQPFQLSKEKATIVLAACLAIAAIIGLEMIILKRIKGKGTGKKAPLPQKETAPSKPQPQEKQAGQGNLPP